MNHYQLEVGKWIEAAFAGSDGNTPLIRSFRFIEEAIELAQATGLTQHEVSSLVSRAYSRPMGEVSQEVGGVLLTLSALCSVQDPPLCVDTEGYRELSRVWGKIAQIREKNATKPINSPLPEVQTKPHIPGWDAALTNLGDTLGRRFLDGALTYDGDGDLVIAVDEIKDIIQNTLLEFEQSLVQESRNG